MKMEKGQEGVPAEPAKGTDDSFSAYGWVRGEENPFTLDNPGMILEYLVNSATPIEQATENTDSSVRASALLNQIDHFLAADAGYAADKSAEGYKKALVAMYMVGVQAALLEEEQDLPTKIKLKLLRREVGQRRRYAELMEANKDREIGRRTAESIARTYAKIRWMEDVNQAIRIGEMTRIVWQWMAEHEQLVEYRPDTEKGLREWLKPVAADFPHAQKRGPRSKG